MTTADKTDFVVIGGGIVGLATALRLLDRAPGAEVVVLEKESDVARHQSGHNSGVIHAGIYYAPGSLKARLCKEGAEWTRRFCDEHAIPYKNTGKLIVATDDLETDRMAALFERAQLNGLDVEKLDAAELRRREPNVVGRGAIFLRTTGIVDYRQVCRAMADVVRDRGGQVRLASEVSDIRESGDDVRIATTSGAELNAGKLVVCGGLQADRLAALAGLDPSFQIVPFRGEYYRLPASRAGLVSTLIYPVPDPDLPFLGVHLTLTMDDGITVGPNAVLGLAREGYPKRSFDRRDAATLLRFPGFWRVARAQWRTGLVEQWNSFSTKGYLGLVRRYCPTLTVDDLLPEPAGIRAQAVLRDGTLVHDFLFEQTDRMLHVCNAPSPAATSAMPIAAMIADRLFA